MSYVPGNAVKPSVPWGAAFCDHLCFRSSVSALQERSQQQGVSRSSGLVRGLLAKDQGTESQHRREPTRRDVLNLAWPHAVWLLFGCIALACRLPFSLSMPHFVSAVIGALVRRDVDAAREAIVMFFCAGLLDSIGDFFCVFLFSYCQQKIIRSLRVRLFAAILKQEVGYFDANSTGEITSRLSADCAEMANDLTWVFRFAIEALVRIGGIMGYMFIFEPRLALVAVSIIPVVAAINKCYGEWLNKNMTAVQESLAQANSIAHEAVGSFRTVYSFAQEHRETERYNDAINDYYTLNVRQSVMQSGYYMLCCTFLGNCCVQAALLIYGTKLVMDEGMPVQTLLAFMLYQGQLLEYFNNLINSFTNLIKSAGAGAKVFEILARKPEHITGREQQLSGGLSGEKLEGWAGDVTFNNVEFAYPTRPKVQVLRGVNFKIKAGQTCAFVGASGAGKSTIFHLLEHFYEPTNGVITLGGVDLRLLDHVWLHSRIATVGQEPVLFQGSIAYNIAYGAMRTNQSATIDDFAVQAVAQHANAHNFISQLPEGYSTAVGERGLQLSGGQKQRIAIARALLLDPILLLLDEATSALDSAAEVEVQHALENCMAGRTTLVIAHRLSTIAHADQIMVMDAGRIIESGQHQELMCKTLTDGQQSYRALIDIQSKQG